ncbi:ABC transporter permease [Desulfobacter sp.]|uniref:ABC transporter permease n=1 Tax=Desulfobacter sp. TaxID=2294 RepID=UPI003D0E2092
MLHGYGLFLLQGAWVTVKLAAWATGIGLVLGLAGVAALRSGFRPLVLAAEGITIVVRGIPELLFVLGTYLISGLLINNAAAALEYDEYIEISAVTYGIITLGIIFGAYATEVFRGAAQALDPGQMEAAAAFGMGRLATFRRVIFPQMWRIALPGIGNLFMVLLKNTALLSVIGVNELMRNAASAVGFTKEPFTFYLAAAVVYLGMTAVGTLILDYLEQRASRGYRKSV